MAIDQSEKKTQKEDNDSLLKPDAGTQNTTDPQEHMEGPISSLMKKTEESFESDDSGNTARKDADE